MRERLTEPEALRDALRGKLSRAIFPALSKLSRAARGHDVFHNDRELRACLALAKLAPVLLGDIKAAEEVPWGIDHPDWWTDERKDALAEYERITAENDRRIANGETLEFDN